MKALFLTLSLCCSFVTRAANYYFSSSLGDDSRTATEAQNPLTPWRSLGRLNSFFSSLLPGDSVLFRRGDVFDGFITAVKSGTQASPIVLAAYGSGAKPVINGLTTLTSWVSAGNGVWESQCPASVTELNTVLVNGTLQAMGRFPNSAAANSGYLTIESRTDTTLASSSLVGVPDFTGGEVVTRTNRWVLDRNPVKAQEGTTVTFARATAYYSINKGYGFFFQNHPATLDQTGEWYFDKATKKIKMHFGSNGPSAVRVQVAVQGTLFTATNRSYLTVSGLVFRGANKEVLAVSGTTGLQVDQCEIYYAGTDAVNSYSTYWISNFRFINSVIAYSNNNALALFPNASNCTIQNNVIRHTGALPGMGLSGDLKYMGIVMHGENNTVAGNRIDSIGYTAIKFGEGSNNLVKNNLITTFCFVKDDGAGIYTYNGNPNSPEYSGQKIIGNIILNAIGAAAGVSNPQHYRAAQGIYLDDNTANVEITGNTVAYCDGLGLFNHNARNLQIRQNTFYSNGEEQVHLSYDNSKLMPIRNNIIKNNIFFAKTIAQKVAGYNSISDDIAQFGAFDSNYYCRPLDDRLVMQAVQASKSGIYDLGGWQSSFDKDNHSSGSPVQIQPYSINSLIGANQFSNGNFHSTISGLYVHNATATAVASWDGTGKLDGGCLRVSYKNATTTNNPVYVIAGVGAVSSSKNYVLKFSSLGTRPNSSVGVFLRKSGSPYNSITPVQYAPAGTDRNEHTFLFCAPASETDASVVIQLSDKDSTVYIDNIQLQEANTSITNPDDHIRFEFNASNEIKVISLNQVYRSVLGDVYSGHINLPPYTSVILIADLPLVALPVKVTKFAGVNLEGKTVLNWETAGEKDTRFFELEKSENGIDFRVVGTILPKSGAGALAYKFTDIDPNTGDNYYRLKHVSRSEDISYSNIIVIRYAGSLKFNIYPNPATNYISIKSDAVKDTKASVSIQHVSGGLIKLVPWNSINGLLKIDISDLKSGLYLARIVAGTSIRYKKFIKQ